MSTEATRKQVRDQEAHVDTALAHFNHVYRAFKRANVKGIPDAITRQLIATSLESLARRLANDVNVLREYIDADLYTGEEAAETTL